MRSPRVLVAVALFIVAAVPSFGGCTLPLTSTRIAGLGYRLSWEPVNGATNYEVQVSSDNFLHATTLLNLPTGSTGVTVNELTSSALQTYSFRITASNSANASDIPCSGTFTAFFGAGGALAQRVNRIVLPVVGSTRGQNNASFKTSLRLGPASATSAGKIVFHPAGRAGSDDDPSIPYRVERGETEQFDDVVAAIGQSGIGSLDILQSFPSVLPTSVLPVEARLFNDGAGGTYGTFEAPVLPVDAFKPIDWNVFVPSSRFRVNIGIRTLTNAHVTFFLIAADGAITEKIVDYAADYVFLDSADHFFGKAVNPGDSILINIAGDNVIAIPFHTFTDNSTNDPAVFNPQSPAHATFPVLEVAIATP